MLSVTLFWKSETIQVLLLWCWWLLSRNRKTLLTWVLSGRGGNAGPGKALGATQHSCFVSTARLHLQSVSPCAPKKTICSMFYTLLADSHPHLICHGDMEWLGPAQKISIKLERSEREVRVPIKLLPCLRRQPAPTSQQMAHEAAVPPVLCGSVAQYQFKHLQIF